MPVHVVHVTRTYEIDLNISADNEEAAAAKAAELYPEIDLDEYEEWFADIDVRAVLAPRETLPEGSVYWAGKWMPT